MEYSPDKCDFSQIIVIPILPSARGPETGDPLPNDIVGAQIIRIGTGVMDAEGGGLIIDYIPAESATTRRVVFAFNELGMWIIHQSTLQSNPGASLS